MKINADLTKDQIELLISGLQKQLRTGYHSGSLADRYWRIKSGLHTRFRDTYKISIPRLMLNHNRDQQRKINKELPHDPIFRNPDRYRDWALKNLEERIKKIVDQIKYFSDLIGEDSSNLDTIMEPSKHHQKMVHEFWDRVNKGEEYFDEARKCMVSNNGEWEE